MQVHDPIGLLHRLCALPSETEWLEFKQNNFSPEAVGRYVSALANSAILNDEDHAYLAFGVADGTHDIVGTSVRVGEAKVGSENFFFWLAKQLSPRINVDLCAVDLDGKHVEILIISPGYQEPVKFQGRAYIRVDSSLQPLVNYPQRERALWAITNRFSYEDAVVVPNLSKERIAEFFDTDTLRQSLGLGRLTPDAEIEFLLRERLIRDNMQGGYDASNLLAISSARDLRQWQLMERKGARVVTYEGKSKLDAKGDVTGRLGYVGAFPIMLNYILARIPHREVMEHGVRRTVYEIPADAIRELVANALIHQDFTTAGDGPLIEIYSDRIRIINPGKPLIDPDRFIDAPPRSRNVKLAQLMRRCGLCEERGSGIDRALTAIEKSSLPPPLFQVVEDTTVVTVYRRRPFADMTKEERVRACYQHACLRFEAGEPMSNASLRARFGISDKQYPQASIVIKDAIEAEFIRPLDEAQPNRNARYVPYWA